MTGIVKRLFADRGLGFIHAEGVDLFFHATSVPTGFERLADKQVVTFQERVSDKGPVAVDVEPLAVEPA